MTEFPVVLSSYCCLKTARQLAQGARPLLAADNRDSVIALREIAAGRVRGLFLKPDASRRGPLSRLNLLHVIGRVRRNKAQSDIQFCSLSILFLSGLSTLSIRASAAFLLSFITSEISLIKSVRARCNVSRSSIARVLTLLN